MKGLLGAIRTKRGTAVALAAAFLVFALVFWAWAWASGGGDRRTEDEANMPRDYEYGTATAPGGMVLHFLRTRPGNVLPEEIGSNVVVSPYYGINGGFFYESSLLSLAVVNDRPVGGEPGAYGSGGENVKYARGTLVWDGATDRLGVQVVRQASELQVTDRGRYWAQGGISMSLGRDDVWAEQAALENAPYPDEDRLRSAAVYDRDGNLYLVVSSSKGTLAAFREAILACIGNGGLADGIFLDGDGSSQLRSRERRLSGDNRPVLQMLRIVR
ncbi:hypothetical protein [Cohnella zeiphila]|uniref:Phosphodiester glycosidase domain-containing protein n=1 Tax=Cohnella zeiphila TaxID=2761120 RepID=A0A7X0SJP9_9BACL|nr:hypothetical protein [Cohnella zeiphila]MBB6729945.1 hypothetical protein [Cohnella zeiphila]